MKALTVFITVAVTTALCVSAAAAAAAAADDADDADSGDDLFFEDAHRRAARGGGGEPPGGGGGSKHDCPAEDAKCENRWCEAHPVAANCRDWCATHPTAPRCRSNSTAFRRYCDRYPSSDRCYAFCVKHGIVDLAWCRNVTLLHRSVERMGPTSCESCGIFDGALWCPATMACYLPREVLAGANASADGAPRAGGAALTGHSPNNESVAYLCRVQCDAECQPLPKCFASANQSCGDCIYVGGTWSTANSRCYIDGFDSKCETADCVRHDASCPACERFRQPMHCTSLLWVVILTSLFGVFAIVTIFWLCIHAKQQRMEHRIRHDEARQARSDASSHVRDSLLTADHREE
jgi:hypothetical protein